MERLDRVIGHGVEPVELMMCLAGVAQRHSHGPARQSNLSLLLTRPCQPSLHPLLSSLQARHLTSHSLAIRRALSGPIVPKQGSDVNPSESHMARWNPTRAHSAVTQHQAQPQNRADQKLGPFGRTAHIMSSLSASAVRRLPLAAEDQRRRLAAADLTMLLAQVGPKLGDHPKHGPPGPDRDHLGS